MDPRTEVGNPAGFIPGVKAMTINELVEAVKQYESQDSRWSKVVIVIYDDCGRVIGQDLIHREPPETAAT